MTIIKKFEVEKEPKKFPSKRIYLVGIFLISLVIAEIWVSHSLVMQGEEVSRMEEIKKSIAYENQILEKQIAESSSLSHIASRSASLGLNQPKDIQYIR